MELECAIKSCALRMQKKPKAQIERAIHTLDDYLKSDAVKNHPQYEVISLYLYFAKIELRNTMQDMEGDYECEEI